MKSTTSARGAIGLENSPTGSNCLQPPPNLKSPAHRNHAPCRAQSSRVTKVIACRRVTYFDAPHSLWHQFLESGTAGTALRRSMLTVGII